MVNLDRLSKSLQQLANSLGASMKVDFINRASYELTIAALRGL